MINKYIKRFKSKIFHKILLTSSLTIIVTVIFLFVLLTNYYSDVIVQKELNLNVRTMEQLSDYLVHKDESLKEITLNLYTSGEMMEDISFALHNGYEEYNEYRLDKFTNSPSFMPKNIDRYFYGHFSQDQDINAVLLSSEKYSSIEYLFIYNYMRWNSSIVNVITNPVRGDNPFPRNEMLRPIIRELRDTITKTIQINNPSSLEKIGKLSVYYSTETLNKTIESKNTDVHSSYFIFENDQLIYSYYGNLPENVVITALTNNQDKLELDGKKYFINKFKNNNYQLLTVIPESELMKLSFFRGTMWVLVSVLTIISLIITYYTMKNYSARIQLIDTTIKEVETGNLDVRIPTSKRDDELTTIANSFNSMLDQVNYYIQHFYVLTMKQQQAELKALQAQINPHFLFNTLEVIRMQALIDGSKQSSKMIFLLSKLFRYTLESKEMVPLYLEIENAKQYLELIQLHYPNKLHVEIHTPKQLEQLQIQKLTLQPIIENYIVHGFKVDISNNCLSIDVIDNNDNVIIKIQDNGKGISANRLKEISVHLNSSDESELKSIGLKNIHHRLKLKHGESYGLTIESKENEGTIVSILLPKGGINHV
ncbi:sensor histidine kinase [Bacillus kwashiorkori]|uniref:sensor histidine kinase n=1 Tax=Bacillus kwashiorkori TaxID=1522318 RepID=UPI00131A156E|nr:sensor histidine kinase [Bacillus kwashiorkori]